MTSPVLHDLCGPVDYYAEFNGRPIDQYSSDPISYDANTQTFEVYSEDWDLIGPNEIKV